MTERFDIPPPGALQGAPPRPDLGGQGYGGPPDGSIGLAEPVRSPVSSPGMDGLIELVAHTERMRRDHPEDELLVLFDVDGTLLDLRIGLLDLLTGHDRSRGTELFQGLELSDLEPDEAGLRRLFDRLDIPHADRDELLMRFERLSWSPRAVLGAHQPFAGMLEVLRWFKHQPHVHVAANTSRGEDRREETEQALATLGAHYGVRLSADFLHLASPEPGEATAAAKVRGVEHFRRQGFRVVAVVDDNVHQLQAIGEALADPGLKLVHAAGLVRSLPSSPAPGGGSAQPARVVWRGLESVEDLGHFLGSSIGWAEIVLEKSASGMLMVAPRERRAGLRPGHPAALALEELLGAFAQCDKGLRLVFRSGSGGLVSRVLHTLRQSSFPDRLVSFLASPEAVQEAGFAKLREGIPTATRIAQVSWMSELCALSPDLAAEQFRRLVEWGVTRASVDWSDPRRAELCEQAREAGLEIDLDAGGRISDYFQAASDQPMSVVSDFGCRTWIHNA